MPLCFIEPQEAIRVVAESVGREARKKRLTEEIDDWFKSDTSSLTLEQARTMALIKTADQAFIGPNMSQAEQERIASAVDKALDDDKKK